MVCNTQGKRIINRKLKRFIQYFLIFLLFSLAAITMLAQLQRNYQIKKTKVSALLHIEFLSKLTSSHFETIKSDIIFLSRSNSFRKFIQTDLEENRIVIEHDFLKFIESKKTYDQIRYIDESGDEIIRVNHNSGDPFIVMKSQLQNKKDRYYFSETLSMNQNEMYISPLDLNVENNIIELPRKPMLRFAIPIYREFDKKGILIFNFLGDIILDEFKRATYRNPGLYSLLNDQGYWLYGNNSEIEWGFMFSDGKNMNYTSRDPQLWQKISKSETHQSVSEGIIYTSIKVKSLPKQNEWILLNTISYEDLGITWRQILYQIRLMLILIIFKDLLLAYIVSLLISQKEEMKTIRLKTELILKEREENLSRILNSIGEAVIVVDLDNRILNMNPVAEKLTGYMLESVEGKPLKEVFHLSGSFPEVDSLEIMLGSETVSGLKRRVVLVSKEGSESKVDVTVSGTVFVINDVTEQIAILDQLNHHSRMEALGQLAGGMVHDFNNMLSGIMNAAQLLQSPDRNLDERGDKYVDIILQASERSAGLIKNLLIFGRKETLSFKIIDLHKMIDETLSIANETIDKKVRFKIEKKANHSLVLGDSIRIQNVMLNLLINASHALKEGGLIQIISENLTLDQSYCDVSKFDLLPGEYCKISVMDTGCGIHPEIQSKIFDPFFTTKGIGKGSGLGLATALSTTLEHSGEILVKSEIDIGSTFSLLLPSINKSDK